MHTLKHVNTLNKQCNAFLKNATAPLTKPQSTCVFGCSLIFLKVKGEASVAANQHADGAPPLHRSNNKTLIMCITWVKRIHRDIQPGCCRNLSGMNKKINIMTSWSFNAFLSLQLHNISPHPHPLNKTASRWSSDGGQIPGSNQSSMKKPVHVCLMLHINLLQVFSNLKTQQLR